jgi:thiamine pyrophosphate-dependent acetolactate synthase large subunit-like protein
VGQVGVWMPWEPDAYRTGRVDYLQKELNDLMNEKIKNEQEAKQHFDERLKESRRKAIEENIRKARENDNKLTQTLDEQGNLVGVKELNTVERTLGENEIVTTEQVRNELFEGDNIRTKEGDRLKEEEDKKREEEEKKQRE